VATRRTVFDDDPIAIGEVAVVRRDSTARDVRIGFGTPLG